MSSRAARARWLEPANAEPERGHFLGSKPDGRVTRILVWMSQATLRDCSCSRLARRPAEHNDRADRWRRGRDHRPARTIAADGPAHPDAAGRQPRLAACRRNGDAVARAVAAVAGGGSAAWEPAGPRRHGVRYAAGSGDDRGGGGAAQSRLHDPLVQRVRRCAGAVPAARTRRRRPRAGCSAGRRPHRGGQPRLRDHPGAAAVPAPAPAAGPVAGPPTRTRTPADPVAGPATCSAEPSCRGHA